MPAGVAVLELNRLSAGPLHAVSLDARPGEVVAVVGPVGSGRTTIAELISGQRRPASGRVVLDGVDITDVDPATRSRFGVGWVRSRSRPFGRLTVAENVLAAASADRGFGGRSALIRTHRLLDRYGLAAVADRPAGRLTADEAARVEVLRVLAAPRRLIVVDELSNDLAPGARHELRLALLATASMGGAVLWLDSPGHFDRLADRVVLLAGGRVLADGPVAEVVATEEYRVLRGQELARS